MEYNFYSRYETGHRKEYIEFVSEYLNGQRVGILEGILSKRPLLFLMIEEWFFIFVVVSCLRALFGLKTSGLTFRSHLCISPSSFRLGIKRFILCKLKKSKFCRVLSITPFEIEPGLEDLCAAYILDFQFWDKDFVKSKIVESDRNNAEKFFLKEANDRIIVTAVGRQDSDKGVDKLIALFNENESVREKFCFIVAGKISGIEVSAIEEFINNGGIVLNRFISDSELVALYELSEIIWCCYSESYDQSSGVFGRAIQFENTPLVREGSIIHKFCMLNDIRFSTVNDIVRLNVLHCRDKDLSEMKFISAYPNEFYKRVF